MAAWKGREEEPVNFNQLLSTLVNSGIQTTNNALYQTISQLILACQRNKNFTVNQVEQIIGDITDNSNTTINVQQNLSDATFWTQNNETTTFASSIQVIAGTGVTLDYSVPNQVTINSSGGAVLPMVNGDEPPQLLSSGSGDLIIIPYTLDL